MKKKLIWAFTALCLTALCLVMLNSCSSPLIDDGEDVGKVDVPTKKVTFKASVYDRSAVSFTRAAVIDGCTRLTMVVFDASGAKVFASNQVSTDTNFGTVQCTLPYGSYRIVTIGHNGTGDVTVVSPENVGVPDGKVTDTFCAYNTLTVDENLSGQQAIAMNRCVSRFELVATDAIPADAAVMRVVAAGGGVALNPKTGLAVTTATQTKDITIPANFVGNTNVTFFIYCFQTEEPVTMEFTYTAKNSAGTVVAERTFADVEMSISYVTRYTGSFFSHDGTVSAGVTINNEWGTAKEFAF